MNKKLVLLGVLLVVGLTLSGCVAVGGSGYGYGYGYDYGYGYSTPHSYGYYNYGYGYPHRDYHRDWRDHRGSWGGSRHWR